MRVIVWVSGLLFAALVTVAAAQTEPTFGMSQDQLLRALHAKGINAKIDDHSDETNLFFSFGPCVQGDGTKDENQMLITSFVISSPPNPACRGFSDVKRFTVVTLLGILTNSHDDAANAKAFDRLTDNFKKLRTGWLGAAGEIGAHTVQISAYADGEVSVVWIFADDKAPHQMCKDENEDTYSVCGYGVQN